MGERGTVFAARGFESRGGAGGGTHQVSLEFTPPVDTFSMADPGGVLRPSWSEGLRFGGALLWAEEMRALVTHPARLQRFCFCKCRTFLLFFSPTPTSVSLLAGAAALLRLTPPTSQFLHLKHIIVTCVFRVLQPSPQLRGTFPLLPKETRP